MKLELKHLAPYLPYNTRVFSVRGTIFLLDTYSNMKGTGIESRCIQSVLNEQMKLILRPLSDLTKEIEHNGKKFVPIIELARMSNFCIYDNHKIVEKHSFGSADSEASYMFSYNKESISFEIENWNSFEGSSFEFVSNNFELVQKLLEWHFDVFSLIEQNLAIGINTLKR